MNRENVFEMMEQNPLKLDDTFTFSCEQCGNCCRHRDDILLSAYDIYRIAKSLNITVDDVIRKHCNVYVGETSRLPVVQVKSKIYEGACHFLKNGKCSIHPVKPLICAIYPLGRGTINNDENPATIYFLQPLQCSGNSQTHKVIDWLTEFKVIDRKEIDLKWTQLIMRLSEFMFQNEKKIGKERCEDGVWPVFFAGLYALYDTKKEFEEQFENNKKMLKNYLDSLKRELKLK